MVYVYMVYMLSNNDSDWSSLFNNSVVCTYIILYSDADETLWTMQENWLRDP